MTLASFLFSFSFCSAHLYIVLLFHLRILLDVVFISLLILISSLFLFYFVKLFSLFK